jgi:hypothetical protein
LLDEIEAPEFSVTVKVPDFCKLGKDSTGQFVIQMDDTMHQLSRFLICFVELNLNVAINEDHLSDANLWTHCGQIMAV